MARRPYRLKPDPEDHRDRLYMSVTHIHEAELPTRVDLRSGCSDVVDQGDLGSCTASLVFNVIRQRTFSTFLYIFRRKVV